MDDGGLIGGRGLSRTSSWGLYLVSTLSPARIVSTGADRAAASSKMGAGAVNAYIWLAFICVGEWRGSLERRSR